MTPDNRELLETSLVGLGLACAPEVIDRLVGYHDFLLEYNQKVNLTGMRDERESVIKNLLNAAAPWRHVDPSRATADVGSGGGLPGIPLAILLDMQRMVLVESKLKKCEFLRQATARFAPSVEVLHEDAANVRRSFGQIVSIAYGSLAKLLAVTGNMRAPGTRVMAWKGRMETVQTEVRECPRGLPKWRIKPFQVPHLEAERHLCLLEMKA